MGRCFSGLPFEYLGEVGLGGKSGKRGYLGDGMIGGKQQFLADFDTPRIQVVNRGQAGIPGKCMDQIVFAHMCQRGELIQSNAVCKIRIQVPLNLTALLCHPGRGEVSRKKLLLPDKADQQDIQKSLAGCAVTGLLFFRLLQ